MRTMIPLDIIPCGDAKNTICADEMCEKMHCQMCKRHLCPVCKKHYKVAIYAGDPKGCSTDCIKQTNGDTAGFIPEHVQRDRARDEVDPGWRGRGGPVMSDVRPGDLTVPVGRQVYTHADVWDSVNGGRTIGIDLSTGETTVIESDGMTVEDEEQDEMTDLSTPKVRIVSNLLKLINEGRPIAVIKAWSVKERKQVANYASAVHMAASDNPVRVPPVPDALINSLGDKVD